MQGEMVEVPWASCLEECGAGLAEALFLASASSVSGNVLLLDEPATQFHPGLQRRLLHLLSGSPSQSIVITHSQLLIPDDERALLTSRFVMTQQGTVRFHWPLLSQSDAVASVVKELRKSSDVAAVLFADGVVFTEGETEVGAFPIWDRAAGTDLNQDNISVVSVGGHGQFRRYVQLAEAFQIPWAIFCDGKIIGGGSQPCLLAHQLKNAGAKVPALDGQPFEVRRQALRRRGIFTLAPDEASEFEAHPCIAAVLATLSPGNRADKIRAGRLVALEQTCQHVKIEMKACKRILARKRTRASGRSFGSDAG